MKIQKLILSAVIGLAVVATVLPASAAPKSEDELMADLASPKEGIVTRALQNLEKEYPNSPNSLPKIKALLTDERPAVREKAARVLGATHAKVSADDLKKIAAMLKSDNWKEAQQAVIALRGLDAKSTVPEIVPLLKNANPFVKRDACRTLAVLGDKSVIKDIEPLTSDPDKRVQKDANDAIFTLKNK
ncbi:MAG TPA: HEAT repeat domain-containing protein [Verrucomicrobiae bacterium]|nr:HEAT repeat domain-containing protein [Verrucomicrobiae bacterium]